MDPTIKWVLSLLIVFFTFCVSLSFQIKKIEKVLKEEDLNSN